jgi:hypothetical protein
MATAFRGSDIGAPDWPPGERMRAAMYGKLFARAMTKDEKRALLEGASRGWEWVAATARVCAG